MKNYLFIVVFFLGIVLFGVPFKSDAITISPPKLELTADPGKLVSSEFILINEEKNERKLYLSAENFEAQGETGVPNFLPGDTGLASWVKVQNEVILLPGETKRVPFQINVPSSADVGGHFAAIFWSSVPPDAIEGGKVSVGAKSGVLLFLRVSGDTNEAGGLIEFKTKNNKKLFSMIPVDFFYRFQNNGSDRINPIGSISIKNMFGGLTADLSANKQQGNVLPGSIRKYEIRWGDSTNQKKGFWNSVKQEWKNFHFGYYKANLDISYGTKGDKASLVYGFFMFPWQLLLIIIVILGLVIFGLWEEIRVYNRWIIKNARIQFEKIKKVSSVRKRK